MPGEDRSQPCQPALLPPGQGQATLETHVLSLEQALAALKAVSERFEGYEPRTAEDCEKVEAALVFADKATRDQDLRSYLVLRFDTPAWACLQAAPLHIDEARMYLSAYRAVCQSRALAHLRLRQQLSSQLTQATGTIRNLLIRLQRRMGATQRPLEEDRP